MKTMNKKTILIISAGTILLAIAVVVIILFVQTSNHIEDLNGEDRALSTITEEYIESKTMDYIATRKSVTSKGLSSSGVFGKFEKVDNKYSKTEIGKLSGIYVGNAYLGKGGTVSYVIESRVSEGNFKIVITDETNKILYDIPIDQRYEISFVADLDKTYYVKLVGESAKIKVEIWRES